MYGLTLHDGAVLYKDGQLVPAGALPEGEKKAASGKTIASKILAAHNTAEDGDLLHIRFDKLVSHDITYVGIIQTARASGLTRFPLPYVLTNCHNSLCAVGGTINEDDHMFGLTAAQKYGGAYVPPHQAVIHQYAREMMAEGGAMILGSDSHTRYGALGTMAVGEGGPELVKQLLEQTYDVKRPEVVAVYLTGEPARGVGPQDVALVLVGGTFKSGFVKNRVLEFVGPGIKNLSMDFRIGIDVMTTESTCLSSIWETDGKTKEYYAVHGRPQAFKELRAEEGAYYDRAITIDLSAVRPMIAMPFHPSNIYTIAEVNANLPDVLHEVEERAKVSLEGAVPYSLADKIRGGRLLVEQGVIAGCAGGGFENLCAAADILDGRSTGSDKFSLNVYPASMPIYMELMKNGQMAKLIDAGAVVKTCFCGPCFGAGDTPANNAFSIRHSTRNFPNREGSKPQNGQIASVALMDARSIAATAANGGYLTDATSFDADYGVYEYHFDSKIYEHRVEDCISRPHPETEIALGPNIRDWPAMQPLPENLALQLCAEIHDPVTTTDELIPSGETSSYRSNPEGLSEFALSRKVPSYVGYAKEIRKAEEAVVRGECPGDAYEPVHGVMKAIRSVFPEVNRGNIGFGSAIFAVKPGDGSAREQAASCQKVLGGWANFAFEYATKRYRSNVINWGMLPFVLPAPESLPDGKPAELTEAPIPFKNRDFVFFPGIRQAVIDKAPVITGYVVRDGGLTPFEVSLGELTDEEREIILAGCLINYNRR